MASIRIDQLNNTLKKQLVPVYLVTGDEPLQTQEACDAIRKTAKLNGFEERELYHTDSGFEWDTLYHATNSLSLFANKKLIEIRVTNGKLGDAGSKAIVEFCESRGDDTLLLLVLPKIDKRSQSSKWYKSIDAIGHIISIWPITPQTLPKWLDSRLKNAGLNADSEAIDILATKVEGNLLAAVQEIEKLKLLNPENKIIDVHTMAQAVVSSARYDVFGMVDKALTGLAREASQSLLGVKAEGTKSAVVLWALSSEIRKLAAVRESMDSGMSLDFAAKNNGVWQSKKNIYNQALRRLDSNQLHMLIRQALNTEKIIKGALKGDEWANMLDMVLALSGTPVLTKKSQRILLQ